MRITRSLGAKAGVAFAATTAAVTLTAAPSAFAAPAQGTATFVNSTGNVYSGNLNTPFLMSLSAPGVCSGTSSTAPQYFVYGFIVPPPASNSSISAELAGVTWSTGAGSSYDPIYYDSVPDQYGPANTTTTGQPMAPPQGAQFTFGYTDTVLKNNALTPLESKTWEVGLACETGDKTVDYWYTPVTFDASGNWTTPAPVAPEVPLAVILPAAGVGLLGGSLLFARRRNRSQPAAA